MPTITLADSGLRFECPTDDTITRAGLRAGLGMPYECNVGCCGTCKVELVEGAVEPLWAEAPALTERDRGKGRVLGCQSRPKSDCTIKVRLSELPPDASRPRRFKACLTAIRDLTHDIREFQFSAGESAAFLPGQYVLFSLPGIPGPEKYDAIDDQRGVRSGSARSHGRRCRDPGCQKSGRRFVGSPISIGNSRNQKSDFRQS